jgi:hypothetical protein
MRHLILLNLKTKVISAVQVAINKKKKRLGRSQYLSISTPLKLGPSKLPFWKRNEKFGRSLILGLFFLALVFVLTGCRGFLDDYNYNPVGAMASSSNP